MCRVGLLLLLLAVVARAEVFTSLLQFEQVLHTEHALARRLEGFIEQEERRIEQLRSIAADYASHSRAALADADTYLANPLNAFLLVKRFTADWQKVADTIRNPEAHQFVTNVTQSLTSFPDQNDLVGSARALLRLQDTYALQTDALAQGRIKGVRQVQQLNADDCFQLGRIAYEAGDFYHAILWFQQNLEALKAEDAPHPTIAKTLDYLSFSLYSQGNIKAAMDLTLEWLEYEPDSVRAHSNIGGYRQKLTDGVADDGTHIRNDRILRGYRATKEFADYERLCRGEKVQVYPHQHKLFCHYRKDHPFYLLRPLKVEVMYLDPFIQVFHDLITDEEIDKVKALATPMLHTSMLFKTVKPVDQLDDVRVSMSAWLPDSSDPMIEKLSKKVEYATGLATEPAEAMQVLNYGLGGHYEPHLDFGQLNEDRSDLPDFVKYGNRISTSLYYMTDVAAGGATVFVDIGVHVAPEKGSMVHWYNLKKSGQGDYRTHHAGCPVLAGTKWVCNKWIHEYGQEFRRPCSTNINE